MFRATLSVLRINNSMDAVQVRRALPAATCKCRRANADCPSPNAPLTRSPPPQPGKKRKGASSAPAAKRKQRAAAADSDDSDSDGDDGALSDSSLSSLRFAAVQDLLLLLSAPLFSLHGHEDPLQNLISVAADLLIGSEPAATRSHPLRPIVAALLLRSSSQRTSYGPATVLRRYDSFQQGAITAASVPFLILEAALNSKHGPLDQTSKLMCQVCAPSPSHRPLRTPIVWASATP